jgi:hypothetical protein
MNYSPKGAVGSSLWIVSVYCSEGCRNSSRTTHGMSYAPEFIAWQGMKQRCYYEKHNSYKDYGGRGIAVCERWHVFENFYEDMGERPSPDHSIERIDVNGNYEPGNCKWVTWVEQIRNRRNTVRINYAGESRVLVEVCNELGFPYAIALSRLKSGIAIDEVFDPEKRKKGRKRIRPE